MLCLAATGVFLTLKLFKKGFFMAHLPSDVRLFFDVKVALLSAADRLENKSVCKYEYEEKQMNELVSECRKLAHLIGERSYKGPFEEVLDE